MSCFSWKADVGIGYLQGPGAGFTGSELSFRDGELDSSAKVLLDSLGASRLLLLTQCHGIDILNLKAASIEQDFEPISPSSLVFQSKKPFDGLKLARAERSGFKGTVLGIKTADCIPVILCGKEQTVLLHAGWRGLAAGIIEEVLKGDWSEGRALVGPCAGAERYEVGPEVLTALGSRAVFRPLPADKALLDLAGTAERILLSAFAPSEIRLSGCCTISDLRFHSFRRDGPKAGRNISFVAIG